MHQGMDTYTSLKGVTRVPRTSDGGWLLDESELIPFKPKEIEQLDKNPDESPKKEEKNKKNQL